MRFCTKIITLKTLPIVDPIIKIFYILCMCLIQECSRLYSIIVPIRGVIAFDWEFSILYFY